MSVFAIKPKHIPCDTIEELMVIADEREAWAKEAEEKDMHGSAAEWRLTAKLARRLIGETWLTSEQTRILSEVLNSRAFQSLIGAEEWDLTEPDEEMLWEIIKAWPK